MAIRGLVMDPGTLKKWGPKKSLLSYMMEAAFEECNGIELYQRSIVRPAHWLHMNTVWEIKAYDYWPENQLGDAFNIKEFTLKYWKWIYPITYG